MSAVFSSSVHHYGWSDVNRNQQKPHRYFQFGNISVRARGFHRNSFAPTTSVDRGTGLQWRLPELSPMMQLANAAMEQVQLDRRTRTVLYTHLSRSILLPTFGLMNLKVIWSGRRVVRRNKELGRSNRVIMPLQCELCQLGTL